MGSAGSSTDSLNELCRCGHQRRRHLEPPGAQCVACPGDEERAWRHEFEPEPPMTPEEEEAAPEDEGCACGEPEASGTLHRTDGPCYVEELPPPQPDRRPPYTVAYSVQGHLYEVALSGDAAVRAVDGGLVITHHLGPVAGLVQIQPMIKEGQ
jgi:hypothetical protein